MGLLVFMRNLLLALCLFLVLGFLYYSAWKLHLLRWEDSSKYEHCVTPSGLSEITSNCCNSTVVILIY